eukprot:10978705-Lingulodinium_polyedra.AAC.1
MRAANEENQWHGQTFPGGEIFAVLPAGARLGLCAPGEGAEITATRAIWIRVRLPAEAASRAARAGVGDAVRLRLYE